MWTKPRRKCKFYNDNSCYITAESYSNDFFEKKTRLISLNFRGWIKLIYDKMTEI